MERALGEFDISVGDLLVSTKCLFDPGHLPLYHCIGGNRYEAQPEFGFSNPYVGQLIMILEIRQHFSHVLGSSGLKGWVPTNILWRTHKRKIEDMIEEMK